MILGQIRKPADLRAPICSADLSKTMERFGIRNRFRVFGPIRLYSISRVFWPAVFGEINMCELLILKLNVFLNASDFSSIVWRWIHSLFNEKESSLEPQNSKNQNTFPSWFLVRKTSWRIPAGFSKFSTEIFDRDFRPYRIQPKAVFYKPGFLASGFWGD